MSTAFVAGATGYTGRAVVRELVARGVDAIAHVRPDSSRLDALRAELDGQGARVDTTPWDEAALVATFTRVRPAVVFALLGTTAARARAARRAGRDESYEAVDYALTVMLVRAAVASGVRPRFVYLSALGARAASSEYFATRHRAERVVAESGLPYVIARPSFISGPDREEPRTLERLFVTMTDGALGGLAAVGAGALRDRFGSTTARELASGLVSLALDPTTPPDCVAMPEDLRAAGARAR